MTGIVGRLFREFAVTLSVAIVVSLVVSLTTTPMMCAMLLKEQRNEKHGRFYRASEAVFDATHRFYEVTLGWVLRHPAITLIIFLVQPSWSRSCSLSLSPRASSRSRIRAG